MGKVSRWRKALASSLLLLALTGCGSGKDGGSGNSAPAQPTPGKTAARTTPMDRHSTEVRAAFQRLFDCKAPHSNKDSCWIGDKWGTSIDIWTGRRTRGVEVSFPVLVPDKRYTRHPVEPPQEAFKLLRYLFPWWKDSDAWLNQAIRIGQGKTDLPYKCPSVLHWNGLYIWAITTNNFRTSWATLHLHVTRIHPSESSFDYTKREDCPRKIAIIELGAESQPLHPETW